MQLEDTGRCALINGQHEAKLLPIIKLVGGDVEDTALQARDTQIQFEIGGAQIRIVRRPLDWNQEASFSLFLAFVGIADWERYTRVRHDELRQANI